MTATTGNGTWQYSTDGMTWHNFGAVTAASALLLDGASQVRYVPDQQNGETATLTFRAWDETTGVASTNTVPSNADTTTNGGTTAFSTGTAQANMAVTSVNDAPTLAGGPYALTGTNEDITSSGTTVNTILSGVTDTDVDTGALKGMAVTATIGNGTWQYSTDGTTWHNFGAVSAASALLLDGASQVRYVPDHANGETATLAFRAWDETTGTASTNTAPNTADTTANGGTTAFSTGTAQANLAVSSVNDAPTLAGGPYALTGTNEDTTSSGTTVNTILSGVTYADVDTGAVKGMAVTATTGNGTWQYSTDGATWHNFGTVTASAALLLDGASQVRYVPDQANGETATLTFRAWDETTGTASTSTVPSNADSTTNGGTLAFSTGTAQANMVVTTVPTSQPPIAAASSPVVSDATHSEATASTLSPISSVAASGAAQSSASASSPSAPPVTDHVSAAESTSSAQSALTAAGTPVPAPMQIDRSVTSIGTQIGIVTMFNNRNMSRDDVIDYFNRVSTDQIVNTLQASQTPLLREVGAMFRSVLDGGSLSQADLKRWLLERGMSSEAILPYLAALEHVTKEMRSSQWSGAVNDLEVNPSMASAFGSAPDDGETLSFSSPKVALLVAVEKYSGKIPSLETPASDVRALQEALHNKMGYDARILLNPTKAELVQKLWQYSRSLTNENDFIMYYAGHGFQPKNSHAGYWLLSDARTDRAAEWVSTADVGQQLNRITARHAMLISDSCYSGTLTQEMKVNQSAQLPPDEMQRSRAVVVMSSGGEEPVLDEGGDGHSLFARKLLDQITSTSGDRTGFDIFSSVKNEVTQTAPQTPQYGAILSAGHVAGSDYMLAGHQ